MTLKTHKRVTYCFIILIQNLLLVKLAKLMINALSVKSKKNKNNKNLYCSHRNNGDRNPYLPIFGLEWQQS